MKRRIFAIFLMLFTSTSLLLAAPQVVHADTNPAGADAAPSCDAGQAFTWIICGAIKTVVWVIDWIRDNIIVPFLAERPLDKNDKDVKPVYNIWAGFRNVASVFFILIFFLVIFGTAIGWDNYTVKKILPRLVAGAVLVPLSWYICVVVVDIGNILGQGLLALTATFIPQPDIDFTSGIAKLFLGGAIALGVAGAATALATISLGVLMTMLIGFLAVFFTLVFRKILIILLIVVSPFALLAWILPNTEKWFKEWWTNFFKLIMMYPIIMMLFEAGRLFAATAGATAGNTAENGVTPLFQLVGLTIPLFGVPFAFRWAGAGMKAGQNAIGKVAGAADKRYGKDSAGAKERAEQRMKNNARRALDTENNPFGNKTLGAIKRGVALKRSGLGGFTGNTGIPGLRNNAAKKQRINAAAAKAEAEEAQSNAQDRIRKDIRQTSKMRVENQEAAAYDKLEDQRVAEAAARKDERTGLAIRETALDPDGINYLKERVRKGTADERIAALQRLSGSQSGIRGIMELRTGEKIIQNPDGTFKRVAEHEGETWKDANGQTHAASAMQLTDSAGRVLTDANGNPMRGMGGTDTQNVDARLKSQWDKGTKEAKGMDIKKPLSAAANDMAPEDVAGLSVHETRRYLEYYDRNLRETEQIMRSSAPGSAEYAAAKSKHDKIAGDAAQFNATWQTANTTATLKGRMLPESVKAVAAAGAAGNLGIQPATSQAAQTRAAEIQPTTPTVTADVSKQIMAAAGGDIPHASAIHATINQEINNTGSSTLKATIENKSLNNQQFQLSDLGPQYAHLQTAPTPQTAMPQRVQDELRKQYAGDLNTLAAIHHEYDRPEAGEYRDIVHQAVLNGKAAPPPMQ